MNTSLTHLCQAQANLCALRQRPAGRGARDHRRRRQDGAVRNLSRCGPARPHIAGRSPGQIAREIYYIQTGDRSGPSAALMKPVVEKLSGEDVLALSAYVASLQP